MNTAESLSNVKRNLLHIQWSLSQISHEDQIHTCKLLNAQIKRHSLIYTCYFSSRSEEFDGSDYFNQMANNWTPEKGFASLELKDNPDSFPRPGVGNVFTMFTIQNGPETTTNLIEFLNSRVWQ